MTKEEILKQLEAISSGNYEIPSLTKEEVELLEYNTKILSLQVQNLRTQLSVEQMKNSISQME